MFIARKKNLNQGQTKNTMGIIEIECDAALGKKKKKKLKK